MRIAVGSGVERFLHHPGDVALYLLHVPMTGECFLWTAALGRATGTADVAAAALGAALTPAYAEEEDKEKSSHYDEHHGQPM